VVDRGAWSTIPSLSAVKTEGGGWLPGKKNGKGILYLLGGMEELWILKTSFEPVQ